MEAKWTELTSTIVGDGRLIYYRTQRASSPCRTGQRGYSGYGHFLKLVFADGHESRVPQKLLRFLRERASEYDAGRPVNDTITLESMDYTLRYFDNTRTHLTFSSSRGSHTLIADAKCIKKLMTCLEILELLQHKQPDRVTNSEDYTLFVTKVFRWATAKHVYQEVCRKQPVGRRVSGREEFLRVWESVKQVSYTDTFNALECFGTVLKERIPINNPHLVACEEDGVGLGYEYLKDEHEWHAVQLLVHMIYEQDSGRLPTSREK